MFIMDHTHRSNRGILFLQHWQGRATSLNDCVLQLGPEVEFHILEWSLSWEDFVRQNAKTIEVVVVGVVVFDITIMLEK